MFRYIRPNIGMTARLRRRSRTDAAVGKSRRHRRFRGDFSVRGAPGDGPKKKKFLPQGVFSGRGRHSAFPENR